MTERDENNPTILPIILSAPLPSHHPQFQDLITSSHPLNPLRSPPNRFPRNENEVRTIASVSGSTVTFTEPLEFEHVSVTQTLGGREVKTRAEVGLLTRNVKIRGNINEDFTEEIESCGEAFNPSE